MLFDEIITIVKAILDEGYKQTIQRRKMGYMYENKNMCRAAYDIYLSIEEIQRCMDLVLTHYFSIDYEVVYADTQSFDTAQKKWEYFTNKDFRYLNKSVVEFVKKAQMYKNIMLQNNLDSFLDSRSDWVNKFSKKYKSGIIDGMILEVKYLPFARPLDEMTITHSFVREPVIVKLDVSTLQKREDIKQQAQIRVEKIVKIKAELKSFILKHCSLEDVL